MEVNVEEQLRSYLNPNYWQGHSLGYGPDTSEPNIAAMNLVHSKFANACLKSAIRSNRVTPLQTFTESETFDPAEHEPGTVVLFRSEMLWGEAVENDYHIEDLLSQELPPRPLEVFPCFGQAAPIDAFTDTNRSYVSNVRWGIVPNNSQNSYLSVTLASGVFLGKLGARAVSPFVQYKAPINIGNVQHYLGSKGSPDIINRVNILHVVSNGLAQQKKSRVFNIAFRPNAATT